MTDAAVKYLISHDFPATCGSWRIYAIGSR
mgnify:CR=1 FL=1